MSRETGANTIAFFGSLNLLIPSENFWRNTIFGIALAAGFYPMALLLTDILCGFPASFPKNLIGNPVSTFVFAFVAFTIFAGMVSTIGAAAIRAVLRTLKVESKQPLIGIFLGGFVGAFCTLPLGISSDSYWAFFYYGGIATVLGQIGGMWGGCISPVRNPELAEPTGQNKHRLRISSRQLLIITAWIAGALSVLKFTGLSGYYPAVLLVLWFVMQLIPLTILWKIRQVWQR